MTYKGKIGRDLVFRYFLTAISCFLSRCFLKKLACGAMVLGMLAAAAWVFCPQPPLDARLSWSRAYFDERGHLLRLTLADDQRYRLFCPLGHISSYLTDATVLYEDQHFYRHPGVDLPALGRAFWTTYIVRDRRRGASTLTMQVARLYWNIRTDTLSGKLHQILRALQLTRHYDKDRILEAYLNMAPYGSNIEGVQAASLIYFGKTADRLTLPEALTLAVVPQNPVQRYPARKKGFERLLPARHHLFARWLKTHPEDQRFASFLDASLSIRSPADLPFSAPHVISDLEQKKAPAAHGIIHTTLDLNHQTTMEAIIRDYMARRAAEGITNAAAIRLDTRTMAVTALAGSADFFNDQIKGQVNGAAARRSPGSALKPFVYALAMDDGIIHPMSLMKDAPRRYSGFTPENFDQQFLGPLSARDALVLSRNLPVVRLQAELPGDGFYGFLQEAGIGALKPADHYGLGLSLGGAEVTLMELASLYAALVNGGRLKPLRMTQTDPLVPGEAILTPEASFLVLDMLKDNPSPDAHHRPPGTVQGPEVAWKTGTSHGFRDAWAIGVTKNVVMAVWVGNFDGPGNPAFVGRTAAGPLLFELLAALPSGHLPDDSPDDPIDDPNAAKTPSSLLNIRQVAVCARTGELPGRHCPAVKPCYFIPGVSPIRVCTVHRAVPVDRHTGLRACRYHPEETPLEVFEFWPSDLRMIFRMAGVSLKSPPPFSPDCDLGQRAPIGQAPVITTPQAELVYAIRSDAPEKRDIPFAAIADADVTQLHWFVDSHYAGSSPPHTPFLWPGRSGRFDIRVVDDNGRAARTTLAVQKVR